MKIAFIIVTYNTPEKELDRLKSEIKSLRLNDYKIIVIDNSDNNIGYAAAVNAGIQKGLKQKADLFIIANPDVSFEAKTPVGCFKAADYFDIWGYAMRQNGKTYYGGEIDKIRMSGGLIDVKPSRRFVSTDFVSGSLMCIKKEVIEKVGLFDESYFMYYEDTDYCYRAKLAGFKLGIDSQNFYDHYELSKNSLEKELYLLKNRAKFLLKYGSPQQKLRELLRLPKTLAEELINLVAFSFHHKFLFNFLSLNASSLFIKLLSFLNFIFLIRFLKPAEYGIYTLVWAQVSLFSPLADFGTTSYGIVHLPREEEKNFRPLLSFRFFLSIAIFVVTIALSFILYPKNIRLIFFIILASTAIFTNMASGSYFIWNAIKEKLYISSRNSVIFNILVYTAIISSLILWKNLFMVFLAVFIFYSLYTLANLRFIKNELGSLNIGIYKTDWLIILKKAYVFVIISFFAGLYFKLDVFLLKLLKGETEVGIYSAGYKFFEALLFIAGSYNVTATPVFARLTKNASQLIQKIRKDLIFLFTIGIFIAVSTSIFAPAFLPFILKGNYLLAIRVTQIVIFTLPFVLINSVLINTLYVLNKAYLVIFVFLIESVINFTLNITFIPRYSYFASAYITVLSELINLVILTILTRITWIKTYENKR